MSTATYEICIDWALDGNFTGTNEDITSNVKSIHFSRGKSDELGKAEVGQCSITVNNANNLYSPSYSAGALYGNLLPKRPMRIRATFNAVTYNLFYGYIEEIIPHPHLREQDCIITAVDGLDFLSRHDMATALYKNILTGTIHGYILDDAYGNLLTNGNFEVGDPPTGWTAEYCTLSSESTIVKIGSRSIKITGGTVTSVGARQDLTAAQVISYRGKKLTLGAWCYAPSVNDKDQKLCITTDGTGGGDDYSSTVPRDDAWHWMTITSRTIPTDATLLLTRLQATTGITDAGEILYCDGAILVKGSRCPLGGLLDAGKDTVPYWYGHDVKARFAQEEIDDNEQGFSYVNGAGYFCFEDRHHRSTATHQTSQATFTNTMSNITYSLNPRHIYNIIKATVTPWSLQSITTLWTLQEEPIIAAGETLTWWGEASVSGSPVFVDAWTTPDATDYQAWTGSGGTGTDMSGSLTIVTTKFAKTIKLQITNGAAVPLYLYLLRARGTYYDDLTKVTRKKEDSTSQTAYQKRTLELDGKYMTDADKAQDFCDYAIGKYKDPRAELSMSLVNQDAATLTQILSREISDRITVVNTKLGVNGDYFIDYMEHDISMGGLSHTVTYRLADCINEDFWALDYSHLAEFVTSGQTKLGY